MSENPPEVVAFGMAGTSTIGLKVIPAFLEVPGAELVAVGSRDASKASEYCREKGAAGAAGVTYDALLTDESIDVVYVPFPSAVRNAFLAKVVAANMHVHSEKPLAGTNGELKALIDECEAKNLQWMDGTMWYHSKRTKAIEAKLRAEELGPVRHVNASFTFMAPDEAWLEGGNNRTNKEKEPFGCLGDMGHYPISAIMWAFNYEMPQKVQAVWTRFNSVDTLVAGVFVLVFAGGRRATLDVGADLPHRSQYEINCERGSIRVDDLVGGFGRTGNFEAYERGPFVGSSRYVQSDVMGKDVVVEVEPSDHVYCMVQEMVKNVQSIKRGGKPNAEWPKRSLATHRVMSALFHSARNDGEAIDPEKMP